jgi:hypothetical protein
VIRLVIELKTHDCILRISASSHYAMRSPRIECIFL